MILSNNLFWDTDVNNLDWEKHSRYVITRVLLKGTFADWEAIKKYYGINRIKEEILQIRYLDKMTLNIPHFKDSIY